MEMIYMPVINGKLILKSDLLKRVGTMSQIAGFKRYKFSEGRGRNVEAIEINNGNGLKFTVLLDRNLDIAWCDYNGVNLSYISKNSVVSPYFFDKDSSEWLRTFTGGLLATCGISYAGAPCEDNGELLGVHGRIGTCPAENICCEAFWQGEDYIIKISGDTYETKLFGENLKLHREIVVKTGENKIFLHDKVENLGFKPSPIMMIYHFNFGYPLLDEGSKIHIDSDKCFAACKTSEEKSQEQYKITNPQHDIEENVYFHHMKTDEGKGYASIINNNLGTNGLGVYIKFDLKELPYLNQWKMMGEGEYVVGLEPSNCMTLGRAKERERGALRYIAPGEVKDFIIEIGIVENK
jgi:hypothetical protein